MGSLTIKKVFSLLTSFVTLFAQLVPNSLEAAFTSKEVTALLNSSSKLFNYREIVIRTTKQTERPKYEFH